MKKLVIAGAAALLMMTGCASLNSQKALQAGAAAVQAFTITDAQVSSLCKEYMVQTDGENTILPADNSYTKRLANIMAKFKNIGDMNVNYKVYQSNTVNAFASGDGSIRVYSGLMDVMDDEEIFAVIGHELGHVKNKDVRDAYRQSYLIVAARYGISAWNQTAGALSEGLLGDFAQQLASNAYSRRQEYEADEAAFQFCLTNGVNPYAMYNALNVLIALSGNNGTQGIVAQMFSTHPDSAKRAARIKEMADAAGKGGEQKPLNDMTVTTKTNSNGTVTVSVGNKKSGTTTNNISGGSTTGGKVSGGSTTGGSNPIKIKKG